MRVPPLLWLPVVGGLLLKKGEGRDQAGPMDFGPASQIIVTTPGRSDVSLSLKLALTPEEQHHGLMFREAALPQNEVLAFIHPGPGRRVLYMRNTYIPLQAAWFTADGTFREVQTLTPLDETYMWTQSDDVQVGLEA